MLTNSPPVAGALAAHPRAEVVLIGGRLLKDSLVTVGPEAVDTLRQVRADACVLGICSLHPELGMTVTDLDEAHVKRAMVEASAKVIALATADKLRTAGPWVVARSRTSRPGYRRRRGAHERLRRRRRQRGARMTPRWATFGVFFVNGAVIGTWVGHIAWVQERFDFSKSTLGLVILAMAIGVIVALPIMGQAIVRLGSVRATRIAGTFCALVLPLPLLGPEPWLLPLALIVLGASSGAMDVSMNAHGVAVERILHGPIMSSLHAGWSFGGLAGAALVAAAGGAGIDPRVETLIATGLLLLLLVVCLQWLGDGSATAETPSGFVRPTRGVVVLAVLCLIVMVTEGAMADWGGIYLTRDLGTSTAVAALAFAAFSGGMTAARVFGDWLNHRLGAATLFQGGSAIAGLALGGMLLVGGPALAIAGFFLVGIGVANGVPLVFSAAGHAEGESGPNIAAVSSMGSLGFLAGPPFIGFLAEATSLPLALSTLCLGLAFVTVAGRRIGSAPVGVPAIEAAR